MRVFLIGLGRAGCRIAHNFFSAGDENVQGVLADTDLADLAFLKHRYRIPLGERMLDGEGTQGDLDLGREVLGAERYSIEEKISRVKDDVDCFFVVSALGGGTGGAASLLLEELKKSFIEPVYYIGLLPSSEDGRQVAVNAASALAEAVKYCDAFFPIDMDRMKTSTRLKGNLRSMNARIHRFFQPLFQIGEVKGRKSIGENTVDFSDLVKTLTGLSVLGLNGRDLRRDLSADRPDAVVELTMRAAEEMTLGAELDDVSKALVLVLGDRRYIDFLGSIPARLWVEKKIGGKEVRGGDMPLERPGEVEVLLVLSGIKRSARLAALYQRVEALSRRGAEREDAVKLAERLREMQAKLGALAKDMDELCRELTGDQGEGEGRGG